MSAKSHRKFSAYRDPLANKRRRRFVMGMFVYFIFAAFIVGFIIYAVLFSTLFKIENVSVHGLSGSLENSVKEYIDDRYREHLLSMKYRGDNILFFPNEDIIDDVRIQFPMIQKFSAKRLFRKHEIAFTFAERTPVGLWCFDTFCPLFDTKAILWEPIESVSPSLSMTVYDDRPGIEHEIDKEFLDPILFIIDTLPNLNISISGFRIPPDAIREFEVHTKNGYVLVMSIDSNVSEQVRALELLLKEKADDPEFIPQFIDLRIDGRIYYN